jgi:hypothetical protein
MRSAVTRQLSLVTPQIALAIKLLPEPDSPTRPRISLGEGQADAIDGFHPAFVGFEFNG